MNKNSDFENILDNCLERLAKGETLEQCLQSYPEQAVQLEPLLRTAQEVRRASTISPRLEFKARARYEFHSAMQTAAAKRRPLLFSLRPRWAMAVMIISIILLVGGGAAMAARNSMPDSPLYPVKLATEQMQLRLTPSDVGKARVCVTLADRRVAEIIYMADKGDAQQVEVLTQHLDECLAMVADLTSVQEVAAAPRVMVEEAMPGAAPPPTPAPPLEPSPSEEAMVEEDTYAQAEGRAELRMIVAYYAAEHPAALRAELGKAPESVKPALRQAIAVSEAGYERALAALD